MVFVCVEVGSGGRVFCCGRAWGERVWVGHEVGGMCGCLLFVSSVWMGGWAGWGGMGEGMERMGGWGVDGWMIGVVVVPSLGRAGVGVQGQGSRAKGQVWGRDGMGDCG